jgi:hypothetical protein
MDDDGIDLVPHDTDAAAYRVQIEAYRRLGSTGRGEATFRLVALAREIAIAGIRGRPPDYDDAQVVRALLRLRHGDAVARDVWPGQPLVDP